jgi:predicted PurR-regulated permease PerM
MVYKVMPIDGNGWWFTRERILTLLLAAATLLSLYICYLIAKPFIASIAFALALAVATAGPFRWIAKRVANNSVAAAIGVIAVTLLIVGPCLLLGSYVLDSLAQNIDDFQSGKLSAEWRATLERVPWMAQTVQWVETRLDLQSQFSQLGSYLAQQTSLVVKGSVSFLTQLVITLFVLFFLYRDRKQALDAAMTLVPLEEPEARRLFNRISQTIHATVNGALTVALIQAALAGVMYSILGVPGAAIWASLTFVAALVPAFGTVLIWAPIAAYLLLAGSVTKALILLAWGGLAVGTIDNLLYPALVGGKLRLHTVVTFFAIVGGVAVFGVSGLILGPLSVAITTALLDVWWSRTAGGRAAEEAIATDNPGRPPSRAIQQRPTESVTR